MHKIFLWSLLLTFSGSQASRPWAQRNNEFAVDLYQAIHLSHNNNIVFSPLGTTVLLGMVQLGAKGKAQQQIRQTLKFEDTATGEEFSVLKSFFSAISEKQQEFTFNLASALYLQDGFTVKEQYLHGNEEFFQSAIKLVDFQDAKTCAEKISTWVESKTDGKIKGMFSGEDFGPLTRLVLVNAIYFKGEWKQKFRKEDTQLMNFTKKNGETVQIPMMKALLQTKYGYFSESSMHYQVLELPYKGDMFSLIIVLPSEDMAIEEMEKLITADQIQKWLSEMKEEEVEISLPRACWKDINCVNKLKQITLTVTKDGKADSLSVPLCTSVANNLLQRPLASVPYYNTLAICQELPAMQFTSIPELLSGAGGKDVKCQTKFKMEQKLDFKEVLYSLNITEIFSGGCDLSGITDSSDVYVSQIMQKVFLEINEDGSEAAASTDMHIPVIMSLPRNQFVVNHPFLFMMKNKSTESILFMGRVTNPETEKMKGRDLDSL